MYQSSSDRLKAILDQHIELPGKSLILNDRIAEIERNVLELIYEKKKCLDFKKGLQLEAF